MAKKSKKTQKRNAAEKTDALIGRRAVYRGKTAVVNTRVTKRAKDLLNSERKEMAKLHGWDVTESDALENLIRKGCAQATESVAKA